MNVRKWYCATNAGGLRHAFDQIKVAVLSCRETAKLIPYCLVDDHGADAEIENRIAWLADNGVGVIRHRASMLDILTSKFKERMDIFSGHWLRCDIPSLETEDKYVLYTDIDIMFMNRLPDIIYPRYLACCPEHHADDYSYFNSGVIVMNIPALRQRRQDLIRVVERRLPDTAPWDDQGALNDLFRGDWLKLAPIWNWKPYWGPRDEALIVHFHGTKPEDARRMLAGDLGPPGSVRRTIFERNPAGYAHYMEIFEKILASDGQAAVRRGYR